MPSYLPKLKPRPKPKPKNRFGDNPYGTLGPSPVRVKVINKTLKKPPVALPPRPQPLFSLLTDRQIETKARAEADAWYQGQRDAYIADVTRLREDAARRRDLWSQASMAAANANQGMAPMVLAGYQTAASTLGGLSQAATGQVGAATRADIAAQNQALARVGQTPANIGDPAEQQGVEQYVGGYLPAANLAAMGAHAQKGFLGEIADERLRAVSQPWGQYTETVADLDAQELSDLRKLAADRPDYAAKVLDRLYTTRKENYTIRSTIADRNARSKSARAELSYRYWSTRQKAKTSADKAALDRWYKSQTVKLDSFDSETRRINANTGQGRLAVSQQNADTAATKATLDASGFLPLPEVMRTLQREQPESLQLTDATGRNIKKQKAKLVERLFTAYALSVPPEQRPALKKAIKRWVANLRVVKKSSGGASTPSGYTPGAQSPTLSGTP